MSLEASNPDGSVILHDLRIPKLGDRAGQMAGVLDEATGSGHWSYCWLKNDEVADFEEVCEDFEISYSQFFIARPQMIAALSQFEEVYDTSPDNIMAGLDYDNQTGAVHIQDVALRNVMHTLGQSFTAGGGLLQVRTNSADELGRLLSPFNVPYYRPELILLDGSEEEHSWRPDSIEAFYQLNRRLLLREVSNCAVVKNIRRLVNEFIAA